MNLQEQLNRIQEMMGVNESITPKDKMINLIEKKGLIESIKLFGVNNVAKTLDTTPIDLAKRQVVDLEEYARKQRAVNAGWY